MEHTKDYKSIVIKDSKQFVFSIVGLVVLLVTLSEIYLSGYIKIIVIISSALCLGVVIFFWRAFSAKKCPLCKAKMESMWYKTDKPVLVYYCDQDRLKEEIRF